MDKQYSKQVLKEFIERDRMLRENSVKSDYDKFCETTCRAIETILEENKELEEKYYYEKNRARNELDTVYINARYDERDKWKLAIRDIIEENKGYLEHANTAYEYTQREVIEENIKILEELLGKEK